MTRNEFIAQTAVMYRIGGYSFHSSSFEDAIKSALAFAAVLEEKGVAPWKDKELKMNALGHYE